MLSECRDALDGLVADAKRPAGPAGVRNVIGKRLATYQQPERTSDEWLAWWDSYYLVLDALPEAAIEAGMAAWLRTPERFLPNPGQLLELAQNAPNADARAVFRARSAITEAAKIVRPAGVPFPAPEMHKVTDADRQSIRQMAADFKAQLPERKVPEIRSNPAKVHPVTGVSPELRALVDRHRAREGYAE